MAKADDDARRQDLRRNRRHLLQMRAQLQEERNAFTRLLEQYEKTQKDALATIDPANARLAHRPSRDVANDLKEDRRKAQGVVTTSGRAISDTRRDLKKTKALLGRVTRDLARTDKQLRQLGG